MKTNEQIRDEVIRKANADLFKSIQVKDKEIEELKNLVWSKAELDW